MTKCQPWGQNRGRNLTQAEFNQMMGELEQMESESNPQLQIRAKALQELVQSFWWDDLEPDEERLLILQKADWDWILTHTGSHGREERCAPTGYQGWEVDAGL